MDKLVRIFESIKNQDISTTNLLLNANPDLINKYLYGTTPFLYSIECGNEAISIQMCDLGNVNFNLKDNLDSNCLEKSIEFKMFDLANIILKKNKGLNLNEILPDRETILTRCLKNDDYNGCLILMNGGAEVNKPNGLNEYPLQIAITLNKIQVVKEMVKKNEIYINTLINGYNPLLDACEKDLTEIALLLIDNGAELNIQDKDQLWSPLMHSISNNNEIISLKLLEKKCNIDFIDINGNSALHLAVLSDNEYLIKCLLRNNPNKKLFNKDNQTPLDLAMLSEDDLIINMLSN